MAAQILTRIIGAGLLAATVFAAPAQARGGHHGSHRSHHHAHHSHHAHHVLHGARHAHHPRHVAAPSSHAGSAESGLLEHGHYSNQDGVSVHSPAHTVSGAAPDGASAKCSDGSYSFSLHRRGTCSHHGGVIRWL